MAVQGKRFTQRVAGGGGEARGYFYTTDRLSEMNFKAIIVKYFSETWHKLTGRSRVLKIAHDVPRFGLTYISTSRRSTSVDAGPVRSPKSRFRSILTTYWEMHKWSTYIRPSITPSWLLSVIIQRKPRTKRRCCPRMSHSKNSSAHASPTISPNWPISERLRVTWPATSGILG